MARPMPDLATSILTYGDNLDILRRHLPVGQIDSAADPNGPW